MNIDDRTRIRTRRYKRQLTIGCTRFHCPNEKCSRNVDFIIPSSEIDKQVETIKMENFYCPIEYLVPKEINFDIFMEFSDYAREENSIEGIVRITEINFSDPQRTLKIFANSEAIQQSSQSQSSLVDDHRYSLLDPRRVLAVYQIFKILDDIRLWKILLIATQHLIQELRQYSSMISADSTSTPQLFVILLLNPLLADYQNESVLVNICGMIVSTDHRVQEVLIQNLFSQFNEDVIQQILGPLQTYITVTLLMKVRNRQNSQGNGSMGMNQMLWSQGFGDNQSNNQHQQNQNRENGLIGRNQVNSNQNISGRIGPEGGNSNSDELLNNMEKVLGVMRLLFQATQRQKGLMLEDKGLPCKEFYNDAVNLIHIEQEYEKMKTRQFSFCNYPFLLSPASKTSILRYEAQMQQDQEVEGQFFQALLMGGSLLSCNLSIRRQNLIEDTINEMSRKSARELRKPLKITFVGEDAVDEGGVRKEFFQLIMRELLDQKYGIVYKEGEEENVENADSQSLIQSPLTQSKTMFYWFNPFASVEELGAYRLIGKMMGLAIYNSIILDLHFPLAVYKKLLGLPINLRDLAQIQPEVARSFQLLLQFQSEAEVEALDLNFSITRNNYGEMRQINIIPGGCDKLVTLENRSEYICAYIDWFFNNSIVTFFDEFAQGFKQIVGDFIPMFQPEELELLIVGTNELDFNELKKVAQYDGGFNASHPTILQFWETVSEFNEDEKRRLLHFVTSCDRAPIGGLKHLKFVIVRNGPDSEQLPTSHTCFNVLMLPQYSSKQKLRDKLLKAIKNAEGFGLI
ncbi:MAG: putative Ubiquitin-protein ligase E3A [Streblomastix strix]|uniref:HECT-type E3 ubiquitin transferase n=1 Tax=Streblomastix strix TaxID=222440 RepID=A0A5J4WD19_9EUKA|nr:MAG: putative Ubiquitin-protein ligase E3A [Streblomastix strix]